MKAREIAHLREVLDRVANALTPAAILSQRLGAALQDAAEDAIKLEAAVDRAVRALRRLQRGKR